MDLPDDRGLLEAVYVGPLRFSQLGFSSTAETLCAAERRCMKLGRRLVNVGEDWVKLGEAWRCLITGATKVGRVKGGSPRPSGSVTWAWST